MAVSSSRYLLALEPDPLLLSHFTLKRKRNGDYYSQFFELGRQQHHTHIHPSKTITRRSKMIIKELVHSDRVNDQPLASIVLSAAASSRKRDRCDAPENSCSCSAANNDGDDQDCKLFRSRKRVNSAVLNNVSTTTLSESRDEISDGDDEELEDLLLMHRTAVFRELPESPYSLHFKDAEEDEEGLSPSFIGAHPTILRAKIINEDSSTDYIDPPEMSSSSYTHHAYEGEDSILCELDETTSDSYVSRGTVGEDTVCLREQPEWFPGSARPFSWTLPKKGTEPLFTSVQREISKTK
eukprot:scaffold2550_cov153-Skeletonema_menzelii.AAC.7